MAVLAGMGWYTSSYRSLIGESLPNCVAASYAGRFVDLGIVSINGASNVFATRPNEEVYNMLWSERSDGHWCGFPVPTGYMSEHDQTDGLVVVVRENTLAWRVPYRLCLVFWVGVVVMASLQWKVVDYFLATMIAVAYLSLARLEVVMPLLVVFSLLTAGAALSGMILLLFRGKRLFIA